MQNVVTEGTRKLATNLSKSEDQIRVGEEIKRLQSINCQNFTYA